MAESFSYVTPKSSVNLDLLWRFAVPVNCTRVGFRDVSEGFVSGRVLGSIAVFGRYADEVPDGESGADQASRHGARDLILAVLGRLGSGLAG